MCSVCLAGAGVELMRLYSSLFDKIQGKNQLVGLDIYLNYSILWEPITAQLPIQLRNYIRHICIQKQKVFYIDRRAKRFKECGVYANSVGMIYHFCARFE